MKRESLCRNLKQNKHISEDTKRRSPYGNLRREKRRGGYDQEIPLYELIFIPIPLPRKVPQTSCCTHLLSIEMCYRLAWAWAWVWMTQLIVGAGGCQLWVAYAKPFQRWNVDILRRQGCVGKAVAPRRLGVMPRLVQQKQSLKPGSTSYTLPTGPGTL